jgi:hypothetical protein
MSVRACAAEALLAVCACGGRVGRDAVCGAVLWLSLMTYGGRRGGGGQGRKKIA